jgi:hypothetical protein
MPASFYICPAEGALVRDPITFDPLPATGANKPRNSFWLRRMRDGEVHECTPPEPDPD